MKKSHGFGAIKTAVFGMSFMVLGAFNGFAQEKLHIFEYTGYDDPAYYSLFHKKYGKPQFSIMVSASEALQKVKTGYKVNMVHLCSIDTNDWINSGFIEPFERAKIKGWDQYNKFWRDKSGFVQNDKIWVVADEYYLTGLNINTEVMDPKTIKNLDIFLDPKYKNKFAMPDEWSDAYSLAFIMLGITKSSDITPEIFDKASAILRKIHPNVRFYWSIGDTDLIPPISQKEIYFTWAWNSVTYTGGNEGAKLAFIRDVGFSGSACGYAKLKPISPELDNQVYEFINAFNDQSNSVNFLEYSGFGHINEVGMKKLSKKSLEKSSMGDLDKFINANKIFIWTDIDSKFRERATLEYEKIKAGH